MKLSCKESERSNRRAWEEGKATSSKWGSTVIKSSRTTALQNEAQTSRSLKLKWPCHMNIENESRLFSAKMSRAKNWTQKSKWGGNSSSPSSFSSSAWSFQQPLEVSFFFRSNKYNIQTPFGKKATMICWNCETHYRKCSLVGFWY